MFSFFGKDLIWKNSRIKLSNSESIVSLICLMKFKLNPSKLGAFERLRDHIASLISSHEGKYFSLSTSSLVNPLTSLSWNSIAGTSFYSYNFLKDNLAPFLILLRLHTFLPSTSNSMTSFLHFWMLAKAWKYFEFLSISFKNFSLTAISKIPLSSYTTDPTIA